MTDIPPTNAPPPLRSMVRLPHAETDPAKRYSLPDPDYLGEAYTSAYRTTYYSGRALGDRSPVTVDYEVMSGLLMLSGGYLSLTTYELGQEACVEKLRDLWRARRARTP